MAATLESLDYFQGSEIYGVPTARQFHTALKESATNEEEPMPTIWIIGGKTLSGKTRQLLIETELLAREGVIVRPPVQWSESIKVAQDLLLLSDQVKFGELRGRDYEGPTGVFESCLATLIRQAQGRNELITADSPLFTAVPFSRDVSLDDQLEILYGDLVGNSDQAFSLDTRGKAIGSNRAWTTARRLFLHQYPFNKYKYRAFLTGASADVELRMEGLANRFKLHNAQTDQERMQALEGSGYHVDNIKELMRNPARAGGPIKAVISVDLDMDRAALDIVQIHFAMPPESYRVDTSKGSNFTQLMVKREGEDSPFLDALTRDPYYRLKVERELTLPMSAAVFLGVPKERCFLSLLSEHDPDTVLDGNLLSYPGEYLKDIWESAVAPLKVAS